MDSQQPSTVQLSVGSPGSLAKAVLVNSAAVLVNSTIAIDLQKAATQKVVQEDGDGDCNADTTSHHSTLCDAYELKYSKVLKDYENTQEQLQYYKGEAKSQTLLAKTVKDELAEAKAEKDKAKQERIEVLKQYDSFLEEHERKLKVFVQEKDKEVEDLQEKTKNQEETIKLQKQQITEQDSNIAEAQKKIGVFERKIGYKEKTMKTLQNETVFQNNQIAKLKETIEKLQQEQKSLHNNITSLQQKQKSKKWYQPLMFWKKITSCGGARQRPCQTNNETEFPDIEINVEFVDVAGETSITTI